MAVLSEEDKGKPASLMYNGYHLSPTPIQFAMKIVIADDHDLFRDGLRHLLLTIIESEIIETADYDETYRVCEEHKDIQLIFVDLDMPGSNGLEGAYKIRRALPDVLLVVVSGLESADIVSSVLDAGFQGYIPKSSSSEIIKKAIELVISGGVYIPSSILSLIGGSNNTVDLPSEKKPDDRSFSLTAREKEVLSLLAKGSSNKEIARELGISATTVRTHTVSIFRTLNATNRTQASQIAIKHGLV